MLTLSQAAGDVAEFRAGPVRIISVNRADLVQRVLVDQADDFRKMPAVRFIRALTGEGLLINEDALWRRHRRLVAPAFQHRRIGAYADVIAKLADEGVTRWAASEEIDALPALKALSLQIIGRTLFDTDFAREAPGLSEDVETALEYINQKSGRVSLPLLDRFFPGKARGLAAIGRVDRFVRQMVRARRASASDQGDLLGMLLGARESDGSRLSDDEVRDEAITLIVAGHETVATALAWTLHLISRNPEVGEHLRDEVDATAGQRRIAFGDLPGLPLALQVFKESMRLYPAAFVIGREARQSVHLGEYRIPAGAWVMVCPFTAHRDPRAFKDPERFDPARFAIDRERAIPRGAYIPFGAGPRTCIGNQFALMEAQIILATFAQRATITAVDGDPIGLRPMITLNPDRPVRLRLRARR